MITGITYVRDRKPTLQFLNEWRRVGGVPLLLMGIAVINRDGMPTTQLIQQARNSFNLGPGEGFLANVKAFEVPTGFATDETIQLFARLAGDI